MAGRSPPGDPLDDVAVRSANDTALLLAKFDEAIAAALDDVAPPPPQTSARPPLHKGPVDRAGSVQEREAAGGGRETAGDEGGSGWFTPKRDDANAGSGSEAVGNEGGSGWFTPKRNNANAVDETLFVTPGGGRFTQTGHGSPESADAPPGGGGESAPSSSTKNPARDLNFSKDEEPSLVTPRGRFRAEIQEQERRQQVLLPFSSGDIVTGSNWTGAEYCANLEPCLWTLPSSV